MFTGLVLLCPTNLDCFVESSYNLFPSYEICMLDAERYASEKRELPEIMVATFDCFDWGLPT
jgi:hypothetical protein